MRRLEVMASCFGLIGTLPHPIATTRGVRRIVASPKGGPSLRHRGDGGHKPAAKVVQEELQSV